MTETGMVILYTVYSVQCTAVKIHIILTFYLFISPYLYFCFTIGKVTDFILYFFTHREKFCIVRWMDNCTQLLSENIWINIGVFPLIITTQNQNFTLDAPWLEKNNSQCKWQIFVSFALIMFRYHIWFVSRAYLWNLFELGHIMNKFIQVFSKREASKNCVQKAIVFTVSFIRRRWVSNLSKDFQLIKHWIVSAFLSVSYAHLHCLNI